MRQRDGGEHREQCAEAQRDGEAADRARAEEEQDGCGDDRRDVRVEDRREGALKARLHREAQRLALDLVLFLEVLEDEDVRVDGHTDGQDDTGDTRQGQRRIEQVQEAEQHERVGHQGDVGDEARHAVEEDHEQEDGAEADGKGEFRLILGILSERRADRARLDDVDLDRQCAAPEDDGEVLRLFERLLARDLGLAAEDRLADIRCRQHLTIEQDGDRAADVLRREVGELLRALIREFEVDDVLAVLLVRRGLCVLEVGTRQHRIALFILELEHSRLADGLDGGIRVLDARQLDDDAALALTLDDRLGEAQRVDALLHDGDDAVHRIIVDFCYICVLGFEHDMRAALQVEALAYGVGQRLDEGKEYADDGHDADNEFDETILSQRFTTLSTWSIYLVQSDAFPSGSD